MPDKETLQRARKDAREGKSPSTQAGEFVREEMDHIREGKHGASSTKQAIAIGLSKARRAGVKLAPAKNGKPGKDTHARPSKVSPRRSRASLKALQREPHAAASSQALAKQARASARARGPAKRSAAAKKAARTRARNQ